MEVKEALAKLDPTNSSHWTETGKPSLEAVKEIAGDKSITRAQLNEAAPTLTKDTAAGKQPSAAESLYPPPPPTRPPDGWNDFPVGGVPQSQAGASDARARVVAELGADDPRLEPIVRHAEARDRRDRTQTREDRIRQADTTHRAERDKYLEYSKIAREKGSHNAPDWVVNASFITKEQREYGGKIYEAGETIRGYTGRLPITATRVD